MGQKGANRSKRAPTSFQRLYISQSCKLLSFPIKYSLSIAYLISVVLKQRLESKLLHLKKGTFAPPTLSVESEEGRLLPSVPNSASLCYLYQGLIFLTDAVRDLDSPVHLRPALARSASKKRRQHYEDVSPPKNDDIDESNAKKVSSKAHYAMNALRCVYYC